MLSTQSWAPAAAMWLIVSIPHFLSLFPSSSSTARPKGTRKTGPNFSLKDFLTSHRTGVGEMCHRSAEIFLNKLIFTHDYFCTLSSIYQTSVKGCFLFLSKRSRSQDVRAGSPRWLVESSRTAGTFLPATLYFGLEPFQRWLLACLRLSGLASLTYVFTSVELADGISDVPVAHVNNTFLVSSWLREWADCRYQLYSVFCFQRGRSCHSETKNCLNNEML